MTPPATNAATDGLPPPDAMGDTDTTPLPQLVAKVLGTVRIPDDFVGILLDRFQLTDVNEGPLYTNQHKGGGIHAFFGRLNEEAEPVFGLAVLKLFGVD